MTIDPASRAVLVARAVLESPRFADAYALVAIGTSTLAFLLQRTMGWAGLLSVLAVLVVLAAGGFIARRSSLEWQGLLPLSLLVFLAWTTLSLLWSEYQWATLGGVVYLGVFTVLGLFVALTRDTIQIVRAFGTVLRVVLVASLVIEIFAGVLIDSRIPFLAIDGNLDEGGPIQGLLGTRNQLGLVAVVALITFAVELRTRSVPRWVGIGSVVLGAIAIILSRSPVIFGVTAVVATATAALYALRRVPAHRRTFWQLALLVAILIGGAVAWIVRSRLIDALNAGGQLDYRLTVWRRVWQLIATNSLEGWGWVGPWPSEVQPFAALANPSRAVPNSASSAFVDVWFQLGLVGLVIFVGLVGLAFARSWLLAGRRRSILFAWPALVLVALVTVSLAESAILTQWGWFTFVVCCVKAARELSWRHAFERPLVPDPL